MSRTTHIRHVPRVCWTGVDVHEERRTSKREKVFPESDSRARAKTRTRTKAEKRWLRPLRKKPGKEGAMVYQSERWRKRRWSADDEGREGRAVGVNCLFKTRMQELSRLIKETCSVAGHTPICMYTPFSFSFSLFESIRGIGAYTPITYAWRALWARVMEAHHPSSPRSWAAVGCNYSSSCMTEMQPRWTARCGAARNGTARFAFTNDPFRGNDIIAPVAV